MKHSEGIKKSNKSNRSNKKEITRIYNNIRKMDINTIAQALIQNDGLLTQTANFLNVTRSSLSNFLEEQQELSCMNSLSNEINLDMAEYQLLKLIKEGKFSAIKYYLDKKGQLRGYQPKPENTTNIQNGIVIIPSTQNPQEWEKTAKQYQLKKTNNPKSITNN